MHASTTSVARLALVLAAAAMPAIAQQPDTLRGRVTKERPATTKTDTSRGAVAPTAPSAATPSAAAPSATMPGATTMSAEATAIVASLQTDAHAMALLHASNMAEIDAGNVAQKQARDSAVRMFAEHMVTEHTALDQQGTALATQLSVTPALPDSQLPQLSAQGMQSLNAAATDFDRAYVAQQVADHQRTLALVDAAIQKTQNEQLRTALQTQVRPKVAEHLQHAQQLQQRLGGR
jgi:putative membrane protein